MEHRLFKRLVVKKWHFALAAGVLLAVIGFAVAFHHGQAHACAYVPVLEGCDCGDSLRVAFEMSNRTSQLYSLHPVRLEQLEKNQWSKCPDGVESFSQWG